jgi:hypothetical protein
MDGYKMNKEQLIEVWKRNIMNEKGLNELIHMFVYGEDTSDMTMDEITDKMQVVAENSKCPYHDGLNRDEKYCTCTVVQKEED